ncbi:MAG: hypothetical protein E7449_01145 [Ruminococcaceae bacterium]|nr:hypothetical protein [Oscillospiraceae bacterium]
MAEIVDIQIGQPLPRDVWLEAAENLEVVFTFVENMLLKQNNDGMGKQDAEEFRSDAQLALIAMRYVAEFATDNCRFIPLEGLGLK